jgi:putative oxidoreductase
MDRWTTPVRVLIGLAFVVAGIPKFAANAWETRAFDSFGLPWPGALVIVIGAVEIAGGVLLLCDRLTRPTALVLAAVMVGAIAFSGIGHGDVVPSLTVAPLLLVATLFLLSRRPGPG